MKNPNQQLHRGLIGVLVGFTLAIIAFGPSHATHAATTTEPILFDLTATTTNTTATISWMTDILSNSKVSVASTTPVASSTDKLVISNSATTTNHSILVSNLIPDTTYFYLASSTDKLGRTATSSELSFMTLASTSA